MNQKRLALLALLVAVLLTTGAAYQSKPARAQWEYKTVSLREDLTDTTLNTWGADGWELIPLRTGDTGGRTIYYLKRLK